MLTRRAFLHTTAAAGAATVTGVAGVLAANKRTGRQKLFASAVVFGGKRYKA